MGAPPSWNKKPATQHRQIQLAKGLRDASGPPRPLICVLAVGSPRCTFVTPRAFHCPRNIPRIPNGGWLKNGSVHALMPGDGGDGLRGWVGIELTYECAANFWGFRNIWGPETSR